MKASLIGDADLKQVGTAHATTLSNDRAKIQQVLGPSGRFIFPATPAEFRQFLTAAKQLGQDPSELILEAVLVTMEATIATAAAANGGAQ